MASDWSRGYCFFLWPGQRARLRAHRAHKAHDPHQSHTTSEAMAAICAAAPQLAARAAAPGTSSIAPARAFPDANALVRSVTSDARALRVSRWDFLRVAAPHARDLATDPRPLPCSSRNSKFSAKARRLASPSACARRCVLSALERHPRPVGRFRFPVARLPGARRPATAATREDTPRRSRRSLCARALRSVRSPPLPVPDRHRTKPLPRRLRRRARAHRPPSRLPGATLAAAPSSPSRTHLSSSTTHEQRRLDAASGQTTRRRSGASSIARTLPEASKAPAGRAPRARDPADVRPSVPEQRTLEKSHSRNRVSGRSRRGGRRK